MRKLFLLLLICFTVSCSSDKPVRENTIIAAVKLKYAGNHDNYVIKVQESEETGTITVVDSVRILNESFEAERQRELDYAQSVLATTEQMVAVVANNRYTSEGEKNSVIASLEKQKLKIDSLQNVRPTIPDKYSTLPQTTILTRIVKAKVSIGDPSGGREMTETYDFYLSNDLKTVYDMKRSK